MQAPPSTLSCAALRWPYGCSAHSLRCQSHHSLAEENALSYPAGGFSNSELRMPNTADSHEYPDRVTSQTADSGIAKLVLGSFDRKIKIVN